MKELSLIEFDHAQVLVLIEEISTSKGIIYRGQVDGFKNIVMYDYEKFDCLKKLKHSLNTLLKFKLKKELNELGFDLAVNE